MRVISSGRDSELAFAVLYKRYSGFLYTNIYRLTKDAFAAEEIIQEVFTRFWKRKDLIDPTQGIDNYLFISARNAVYDYQQKALKNKTLLAELQQAARSNYQDNREQTEQEFLLEQLALLRRAIDTLPPQRKRVFELCKLEGKSYKQVCEELGLAMGTVKDHMAKGQRSIREYLTGQGEAALILIVLLDQLAD
jgi:RNA polymerase sigma-70 factor (family 1)